MQPSMKEECGKKATRGHRGMCGRSESEDYVKQRGENEVQRCTTVQHVPHLKGFKYLEAHKAESHQLRNLVDGRQCGNVLHPTRNYIQLP